MAARKQKTNLMAAACSGGIDSMAMTWLLSREHEVIALIVDHSLRKESKEEAKRAASILTSLGINNVVLTHKGKKPKANIQEEARKIRYSLMIDYCRKHNIGTLATAHNAEDNAETFLLRLSRGSGVDGLSSIPSENEMEGIRIIRPVLGRTRLELKDVLKKNKIKWVEDPTNATDKYKRNKLRMALSRLEDKDLITRRINDAAANLSRVKDYLESETAKALKKCFFNNEINISAFKKLHEEIGYRVLTDIIISYGLASERPRFEKIRRLKTDIIQGNKRTLGGLIFTPKRTGSKETIVISIEK